MSYKTLLRLIMTKQNWTSFDNFFSFCGFLSTKIILGLDNKMFYGANIDLDLKAQDLVSVTSALVQYFRACTIKHYGFVNYG